MLKYDCVAIIPMAQTASTISDIVSAGLDGFETDIRITSDGVFILHHDPAINGTTIATSTYSQCLAADSNLLTLAEGLALQKANNLTATYESELTDSTYGHDIVDAIVASGVDLNKTYIEPLAFEGTSYYTDYNSKINVVWKGGTLSSEGLADAAQYLTGENKVLFTINQTLLQSMSSAWVSAFETAGLGLVADPVTSGVVSTYGQYPFDQIWSNSLTYGALKSMRDTYRDDPPAPEQSAYDVNGNVLQTAYNVTGSTGFVLYDVNGNALT